MKTLTGKVAASARESLRVSQTKVARELGINRSYLSEFENGTRILNDDQLISLTKHYEALGWVAPKGSAPELIESQPRTIDAFVLATLPDSIDVETLVQEFHANTQEIQNLSTQGLQAHWFTGNTDLHKAMVKSLRPLALMARQYQIQQILAGQFSPDDSQLFDENFSSVATIGDYIENLVQLATGRCSAQAA